MKVLVVGGGFMGSLHARALLTSRHGWLCGVVDPDPDVAKGVRTNFGVPGFADLVRAVDETRPDAAIIATPDSMHREPAETLIDAGVPLLIEKPLATSIEDAEAIVCLAEKLGVRIMVGHLTRFLPRYTRVLDNILDRRLGKPVMITTSTWGPVAIGKRVRHTTSPLWHFGVHDIDVMQWICGGQVTEVAGAQQVESSSGLSTFTATGMLTSGVGFNLATGWTLPATATPRWDLKVHCERGLVQATWSDDGVTCYAADIVEQPDCTAWPSMYGQIRGALRMEVDHFLSALASKGPFVINPDDALRAVRSAAVLEEACVVRKVGAEDAGHAAPTTRNKAG